MTQSETYFLGIDAGSKTVKLVLTDNQGRIIHSLYKRHRSNIRDTLRELIHELAWVKGDHNVYAAITGSAGISAADLLGLPFVQEVIATTEAVNQIIPEADVVIELGGEDAKVVYLTDGVEHRMNATCAGGTGGFIDTIAYMLGTRTAKMSTLAMAARQTYPIASRCAVFAQTDVRPLLNQGASKADIAASALDAVVRQTLGGLACGRPIEGTVVFLGGPLEHIPALTERFRQALHLDRNHAIKPNDAHLYPALGAVMVTKKALERNATHSEPVFLSELENMLQDSSSELDSSGIARLAPLFSSEDEHQAFLHRHAQAEFPRARLIDVEGPLFLGIDSGSTTVKVALLDSNNNLLFSSYRASRGDTSHTIKEILEEMYSQIPTSVAKGKELPYIAYTVATGYGEDMLIKGFGADEGIVETTAHARAARHVCPDVSFVLDIGGQDMKALWLKNGHISDAVLNEACSSGCGAFVEGTAAGLKSSPQSFAKAALEANAPVDLGTRCTVFMSSRVKHAQKVGASIEDIAAGVAYSVVHNALFRIIGKQRLQSMGNRVVVQGGTFRSDAVLRAFELTCGVQAIRPDVAHLMGAIGSALVAQDIWCANGSTGVSALVSEEEVKSLELIRSVETCSGCGNNCIVTLLDFGADRKMVSGNKCQKGAQLACDKGSHHDVQKPIVPTRSPKEFTPANLIAKEQELIQSFAKQAAQEGAGHRKSIKVGVMDALEMYRFLPFWSAFFASLGFSVALPREPITHAIKTAAWETVPAESVCYPAKLAHAKAFDLHDQGVQALFFPTAVRSNHCSVSVEYAHALTDSISWLRSGEVAAVSPVLSATKPTFITRNPADIVALTIALEELTESSNLPINPSEVSQALQYALQVQDAFEYALHTEVQIALQDLEKHPDAHALLVVGRPYHVDQALMHGIDSMIEQLGYTVFGMGGLPVERSATAHNNGEVHEWFPAKRLMKAAGFTVAHPQIDMVCLQSFGCGYDAVSLDEVRRYLEQNKRPFTALKVDEMVEKAHIRIRLRTLVESIKGHKRACGNEVLICKQSQHSRSAIPLATPQSNNIVNLLSVPLDETDLAYARSHTINDVCFSATVLAARAIRLLNENPEIAAFVLPEACQACLNESIPHMVERATGNTPLFIYENTVISPPRTTKVKNASNPRPRIGIIGNPLLLSEPFMNDNLVQLLESLGCEVILPEMDALFTEDVTYLNQMLRFKALDVKHVIYLQSFGCVKAHVHARGSHYELQNYFPDMPITVLDYDPEASALNRENRVRLIVESVMHAMED